MDTIDTWGAVLVALRRSEMAMREARFIILGGGGSLLERSEQAVKVLEQGIEEAQRPAREDA